MNARIMERVVAGGLWLDMIKPGWRELIDWDRLYITDTHLCIAGQVFGDEAAADRIEQGESWISGYDMLRRLYGLDPVRRAALGFTIDDADDQSEDNPWEDLRDAWGALWGPRGAY